MIGRPHADEAMLGGVVVHQDGLVVIAIVSYHVDGPESQMGRCCQCQIVPPRSFPGLVIKIALVGREATIKPFSKKTWESLKVAHDFGPECERILRCA